MTHDEVYFGHGAHVPGELAACRRQVARQQRVATNRSAACGACPRAAQPRGGRVTVAPPDAVASPLGQSRGRPDALGRPQLRRIHTEQRVELVLRSTLLLRAAPCQRDGRAARNVDKVRRLCAKPRASRSAYTHPRHHVGLVLRSLPVNANRGLLREDMALASEHRDQKSRERTVALAHVRLAYPGFSSW